MSSKVRTWPAVVAGDLAPPACAARRRARDLRRSPRARRRRAARRVRARRRPAAGRPAPRRRCRAAPSPSVLISRIAAVGVDRDHARADTPDITASISARRLSSWALAVTSALVCSCSRAGHAVERVGQRADLVVARGVRARARSDRRPRPARAASTSSPTGRTSRSATASAIQTAIPTISSDSASSAALKLQLQRARALTAARDSRADTASPRCNCVSDLLGRTRARHRDRRPLPIERAAPAPRCGRRLRSVGAFVARVDARRSSPA